MEELAKQDTEIKKMGSDELRRRLLGYVAHERKLTAALLEHIAEIIRRQLYLTWGFQSVIDYLITELKYSEAAAYRRMSAARALVNIPEIRTDIESGALNLSQITKAQTSIRQEEKATGTRVALETKKEIFAEIRGMTAAKTESILAQALPVHDPISSSPQLKHKRDESVDLHLNIPKELFAKLQHIKSLFSHIAPGGDWVKIIELMAEDVIKKRDITARTAQACARESRLTKCHATNQAQPKTKPSQQTEATSQRATAAKTEIRPHIPAGVKKTVIQKAGGVCQYHSADGKKCGSRHQLELDHIRPVFAGGENDISNLRVLCRAHNQYRYHVGAKHRRLR